MAQTTGNSLDTSPLHTFLNHLQFTLAMRRHFEHTHLSQQNKKKKKEKKKRNRKNTESLFKPSIFSSLSKHTLVTVVHLEHTKWTTYIKTNPPASLFI